MQFMASCMNEQLVGRHRRVKLIARRLLAFFGFALLFPLAAFSEATHFQDRGNWRIFSDKDGEGNIYCYATAEYVGGTGLIARQWAETGAWEMIFANRQWRSVVKGEPYDLKFHFKGRGAWRVEAVGGTRSVRTAFLVPKVIEDFSRSGNLDVLLGDRRIVGVSLAGTRAAVESVRSCLRENTKRSDPFEGLDPFRAENTVARRDLQLGFSGRSIVSSDKLIRFTLGDVLSLDQLSARFPEYRVMRNDTVPEEDGDIHIFDRNGRIVLQIFYARGTNRIHIVMTSYPGTVGPNGKIVGEPISKQNVSLACDSEMLTTCKINTHRLAQGSSSQFTRYIFEPSTCRESRFVSGPSKGRLSTVAACEKLAGLFLSAPEDVQYVLPKTLAYASVFGEDMTITKTSGLGSRDATIKLSMTQENAEKLCATYMGEGDEDCVPSTMDRLSDGILIRGNCETGDHTWNTGSSTTRFRFLGRRTTRPSAPVGDLDLVTRYVIEEQYEHGGFSELSICGQCGYTRALSAFAALCPNRNIDLLAYFPRFKDTDRAAERH